MKVKIYKPSRNAMQSGLGKTANWIIECEVESARSPESLMGWASSEDTMNQVRMKFPTLEAAIAYAEKEGWAYTVTPAHDKRVKPRNYGDNFKYRPAE